MNKPTARNGGRRMSKQTTYEKLKAEIARTAKTPQEYEKRVRALARKMGI